MSDAPIANGLPWLTTDAPFPDVSHAFGPDSMAPGLLAAGADLSVPRLVDAYRLGIFPWFSKGDPPLWWSPDPRMVLVPQQFRLHRSLSQTIKRLRREQRLSVRFDTSFKNVITHCAQSPRWGRASGTWIQPSVIQAYCDLHKAGHAHSVECWIDDQLVGGLYLVALGQAVFGESMFSKVSNASKIALAALVAFCRAQGITLIDCQQNTDHLGFMGGHEIPRHEFLSHVKACLPKPAPQWRFDDAYWARLYTPSHATPF